MTTPTVVQTLQQLMVDVGVIMIGVTVSVLILYAVEHRWCQSRRDVDQD